MKKKTTNKQERKIQGDALQRSLKIDFTRAEPVEDQEDDRTIEIAFSSEAEIERWFGIEILDHTPQSVKLDRLNGGGAVLVNHDTRDQVGVVTKAWIDKDRVGRALIRFSKSQRGEEIYQDVLDGIRTLISVGYRILKYDVTEEGKSETVRATLWEPHELSVVPIPADASVGVGRSDDINRNEEEPVMDPKEEDNKPDLGAERLAATKAERERINEIRKLSEQHDLEDLGARAIDEGLDLAEFNRNLLEEIGKKNNSARAETKHDGNVDLTENDQKRFSLCALMDAVAHPQDRLAQQRAGFELEVCDAAVKGFGSEFKARGAFVPDNVLSSLGKRDLTAGTATDGAELVATDLLAGSFVEVLRNAMRTMQAGVQMLPGLTGNIQIPRQTSGAAMGWISAEGGDASESDPQFDQITLSPKDGACYTEVTRRLLQQSTPAVDGLVRNDLAQAIGLGMDLAVLYGSGSSGQPTGITNTTGINTKLDFAAALPTYSELVNMIRLVMDDNALIGNPSWFIDPQGWEHCMTTAKQASGVEGNFILNSDKIVGYDYFSTNQVTAQDFIFGDFAQAVVGEWGGLELNTDPYTKALSGTIRYIIFKTCDIAVRQPTAFCLGNDGV